MALLNWTELGEYCYRQIELYDMQWENDRDLEYFYVTGAGFGGPVARLMRPDSLVMGIPDTNQLYRKFLTIHDSAGKVSGKIPWNFDRKMVGMGFTNDEVLVIVYENADIDLYNVQGEKVAYPPPLFETTSLSGSSVLDCEVFENMLIMLTNDNIFCYVRNISNCFSYRPEVIGNLRIRNYPTCFKAIPPSHSYSGNLDILCGNPEGGLILLQENGTQKSFSQIPFTNEVINRVEDMALSVSGEYLALLLEGGVVIVLNSNFSKLMARTDLHTGARPRQMLWCGSDAVCLVYNEFIGILGPNQTTASMEISRSKLGCYCIPELDGMRVVTTEKCEFWEKVDEALQITLSIGSFSPPALLLAAYEAYLDNAAGSGESIRNLQANENLYESVDLLIQAATSEFDIDSQEQLLKAAGFGKTFLAHEYNTSKLVNAVKNLKVLNNVRKLKIARPLTYGQLQYMKDNGELLTKRLINNHHHYLALEIAKFWKLRQDNIYVHWACVKLQDFSYSDNEMVELICSKLFKCKSVSYTDIARKALDCNRKELAIKLLDNEPAISRKVPLLLYMEEFELALDRAIESSDPDLIYLVIMKIHEEDKALRGSPDFVPGETNTIERVLNKPVAREMLLSYAKQIDDDLLSYAYRHLKRLQDAGNFSVTKAFSYSDLKSRTEFLNIAMKFYEKHEKDQLFAALTKEQLALTERQKLLARETGDPRMLESSVTQSICRLLLKDNESKAEKLARQFSVSDKKLWYLKLKVRAGQNDWPGVEKLARQKKNPPIGFKPFANIAVQKNQFGMAEEFILKVNEVDYQLSMLQYIGAYKSAAEVAIKSKQFEVAEEIAQKSGDREVLEYVEKAMTGKK